MLELLISSERAEKFRERHRVIIRDSNKQWREFIINWVQDTMDGYTEIECIASYLADITTAKPYAPGKFEKKTTSEALKDVLSDTGWKFLNKPNTMAYVLRHGLLIKLDMKF